MSASSKQSDKGFVLLRIKWSDLIDKQLNSRWEGLIFFPDQRTGCFLLPGERTEAEGAIAGGIDQFFKAKCAAGPGFHKQWGVEKEVVGTDDIKETPHNQQE